jgi:uncharacterized Zn finger protein
MGYWSYPRHQSVIQKRAKARRQLNRLMKNNPDIQPVLIEGNALVRNWWGRAWNRSLEQHASISSRVGRGKSYVRNCMVLDLRASTGTATALVQGNAARPYEVIAEIDQMDPAKWEWICDQVRGEIGALEVLYDGRFSDDVESLFYHRVDGIFPMPREMHFSCTCSDHNELCKHAAAILYALGTRMDEDPSLFFRLRQVPAEDLITEGAPIPPPREEPAAPESRDDIIVNLDEIPSPPVAVEPAPDEAAPVVKRKPGRPRKTETAGTDAPVKRKPGRPRKSETAGADAPVKRKPGRPRKTETAGADAPVKRGPGRPKKSETAGAGAPVKRKPGRPKKSESAEAAPVVKRRPGRPRKDEAAGTTVRRRKAAAPPEPKKPVIIRRKKKSDTEKIADIICEAESGIDIPTLVEKTGFDERKIYNVVHRLKRKGRISNPSWGLYAKP